MKFLKYTEDQVKQAVKESFSIIGVLRLLKLREAGGNYRTIHKAIKEYNLDTSHFTGQGHLKGKTHNYNTRNLKDILVKGKYESSNMLRKRIIKEKIKEHKCEDCQLITWKNKPIPLELHHIDGDRENNLIENLQLLCPNCHALTDNYRGKNKKQISPRRLKKLLNLPIKEKLIKSLIKSNCLQCQKEINYYKTNPLKFCTSLCANKYNAKLPRKTKINWLPTSELIKMVNEIGYLQAGKKLGVSDNAIRKRIKNHA